MSIVPTKDGGGLDAHPSHVDRISDLERSSTSPIGRIVDRFFEALGQSNFRYCVSKNYQHLPNDVGNDLDLIVDTRDGRLVFEKLIQVAQSDGWAVLRRIVRRGSRTAVFHKQLDKHVFLHLDVGYELVANRTRWGNASYVMDNLRPYGNFFVPQPGCEAALAVRDLLLKSTIRDKYRRPSAAAIATDPHRFVGTLAGCFHPELIKLLKTLIEQQKWDELSALAPSLRRSLYGRAILLRLPMQTFRFVQFAIERLAETCRPTGMFLVLVGPDGSGKTTIARKLGDQLNSKVFSTTRYFHRLPGALPSLSSLLRTVPAESHCETKLDNPSQRARPLSLARALVNVLYYMWDFVAFHIPLRRFVGKGELVLFDRYFYDHFIQSSFDKIPRWLLKVILCVIPRPDRIVFLRHTPEAIHDRKSELSLGEIEKQNQACKLLVQRRAYAIAVDTDVTPDEVVDVIVTDLCDFLQQRELQR